MDNIPKDPKERALAFAIAYGGIDGEHHKAWVIDQMVRALTNCPLLTKNTKDYNGVTYSYEYQGESDEYLKLIKFL